MDSTSRSGILSGSHWRSSVRGLYLSPVIWALHFLAVYIYGAYYCSKNGSLADIESVRWFTTILTTCAIVIVLWQVRLGWRKHRVGNGNAPHDEGNLGDRSRFLGLAQLLVSGLSALAIIYTAYAIHLFRSCE